MAACSNVPGRSDDGPLSKGAFVDRANSICRESRAQAGQIGAPSLADPAAVKGAIAESAAIQRAALRKLRALEPPERDVPGVEDWLEQLAAAIRQMERLREGLAAGDTEAINTAINRGSDFTAGAEEFADAYGISDCSTNEPGTR